MARDAMPRDARGRFQKKALIDRKRLTDAEALAIIHNTPDSDPPDWWERNMWWAWFPCFFVGAILLYFFFALLRSGFGQ